MKTLSNAQTLSTEPHPKQKPPLNRRTTSQRLPSSIRANSVSNWSGTSQHSLNQQDLQSSADHRTRPERPQHRRLAPCHLHPQRHARTTQHKYQSENKPAPRSNVNTQTQLRKKLLTSKQTKLKRLTAIEITGPRREPRSNKARTRPTPAPNRTKNRQATVRCKRTVGIRTRPSTQNMASPPPPHHHPACQKIEVVVAPKTSPCVCLRGYRPTRTRTAAAFHICTDAAHAPATNDIPHSFGR